MSRFLSEDFLWKIVSLAAAFLLWITVVREPELVTSASVPIFYKSVPKGLEISSGAAERVSLEIRGPASKLTPQALSDTAIQLDLKNVARAGLQTFAIEREDINLPQGVAFVRAVPAQMQLEFDRQVTKEVDVRVFLGGKRGVWRVTEQIVNPEHVRIVGPARRVDEIDWAETDPVDLPPDDEGKSGERRKIQERVHLFVDDPHVRFESSPMVEVKLSIERIPDTTNPRAAAEERQERPRSRSARLGR